MNTREFETEYQGKKVLITGHTGFTGGWLMTWLDMLGASICGVALEPDTQPNLSQTLPAGICQSLILNINDFEVLNAAIKDFAPDLIIHLAAQPLVSEGYRDPVGTYMTNAMGTLHVLEAARTTSSVKGVVAITTDKVYRNLETGDSYGEEEPLGGKDPYSSSKACAELIAHTYIDTMAERGNDVRIATARGGNIIGGGDWALNRIVPDCARAAAHGTPLTIRHPEAVRPFQHVLSLVHGYLLLGSHLLRGDTANGSWNFGPTHNDSTSVRTLIEKFTAQWKIPDVQMGTSDFKEANLLHLNSEKAQKQLGWRPPLDFDASLGLTVAWYKSFYEKASAIHEVTKKQIQHYRELLGKGA